MKKRELTEQEFDDLRVRYSIGYRLQSDGSGRIFKSGRDADYSPGITFTATSQYKNRFQALAAFLDVHHSGWADPRDPKPMSAEEAVDYGQKHHLGIEQRVDWAGAVHYCAFFNSEKVGPERDTWLGAIAAYRDQFDPDYATPKVPTALEYITEVLSGDGGIGANAVRVAENFGFGSVRQCLTAIAKQAGMEGDDEAD